MRRHGTAKYDGSLLKFARACLKCKKIIIKDSNKYIDKIEDIAVEQMDDLSIIDLDQLFSE